MEYTPFKCPDCKVWWRGETHKCETPKLTIDVHKPNPWSTEGGKDFVVKPKDPKTPYSPSRRYCVTCNVELWPSDPEGWSSGYCWKHKGDKHKWSKKEQ
jgi:hypothetical protein